jgi:hypothetical protein
LSEYIIGGLIVFVLLWMVAVQRKLAKLENDLHNLTGEKELAKVPQVERRKAPRSGNCGLN